MSKPSHIFIVGLSRTGTTLTRTILNSSDEVSLGGESMFFGDRRKLGLSLRDGYRDKFAGIGDLTSDEGAENVLDYIYEIQQDNFWSKIARRVPRAEFRQRLLATDRSDRALLDLALSFYARPDQIRGEKTPSHIYAVPTLLDWFPGARVIHTFRDPRAVYVSNKRKYENRKLPRLSELARRAQLPFELYASLDVMLNWKRAIRLHHEYQRRFSDRYYLLKYEDLVRTPEECLRELCRFLGIQYQESMLQQVVLNSSYSPKRSRTGFDTSSIDRWRAYVHPMINLWFLLWCKRPLIEFGYAP
jgi:hypothetical protein